MITLIKANLKLQIYEINHNHSLFILAAQVIEILTLMMFPRK